MGAAMTAQLQRRLGVRDAVTVGAGSMIGAGVFSAWGPATDAAGAGVLIGLVLAAAVAWCNATSSAQLAAVHPESGGTYVYGRRQLGPLWGYLAGWGFVVGKTASCVAIALTAGSYLWPDHARLVGITAVVAVAIVNVGGLSRTVLVTKALLAVALVALGSVVLAGWSSPTSSLMRITPLETSPAGVLRAGGFLFFAFAGYARIATLGEEVRDPATTIPKAIPRALAGVLAIYAVVGVTLLAALPVDAIAASDAPLGVVVSTSPLDWLTPVVRIGAGIAALGVLLNLVPGVSRTVLAMARRHELPHGLATVDERRSLPFAPKLPSLRWSSCSPQRSTSEAPSASPASPSSPTTRSPTPPA
jgi:basic amino acid/polyamine antiporter, APA family